MKQPILKQQTFNNDNLLYTGRYFAILKEGVTSFKKTKELLESELGFTVANTQDFIKDPFHENKIKNAESLIYEDLGVVLLGGEKEQIQILESANSEFDIVPEKVIYIPNDHTNDLPVPAQWGLQKTNVLKSQYTGNGIRVAVLDSGFDINHPDFYRRNIITKSFVVNETVHDEHGHGTHCIGIACGSVNKITQARYGVATNSLIYAGKVLNNQNWGAQAWLLDAMMWAVNNECKVISISLGSSVLPGQGYDIAYERTAKFALSKGAIVIAAAGNGSNRNSNQFSPVASPADCPSVIAVAALDKDLNVADFSNRAINLTGKIDIAAPGVDIHSSWPMPHRYRTISGTSMATPLVAGIVALLWEKYPAAKTNQIINELNNIAKSLPLLSINDIGVGLSIAP